MNQLKFISIASGQNSTQKAYRFCLDVISKSAYFQSLRSEQNDLISQEIESNRKEILKALKKAEQVEDAKLVYQLLDLLQSHYGFTNDTKRIFSISEKLNKLTDLYFLHEKLRHHFNEQRILTNNNISNVNVNLELSQRGFNTEYASIKLYAAWLLVIEGYKQNNLDLISNTCEEIVTYLKERSIHRYNIFESIYVPVLIAKGQFNKANQYIYRCVIESRQGSPRWALFTLYRIRMYLYSGDYQKAYKIFSIAEPQKRFNHKPLKEEYHIIKGYLYVLSKYGVIETGKTLQCGKYLNQFEILQKDKQHSNINIIIISCLLYGREYTSNKYQAIEKYYKRHTKTKTNARTALQSLLRWSDEKSINISNFNDTPDPSVEVLPFKDLFNNMLT